VLILIPAVVFGIVYVPRHDGTWVDVVVWVLLPMAGISGGLWQFVERRP